MDLFPNSSKYKSVFYKIWFQSLEKVLVFIADLPHRQKSWYIAMQRKITNVTNADANIRTCIYIIMYITLAKIFKRGANFWEVKMSKLLTPTLFHNTSRRMSTDEVLFLGLCLDHCFPLESQSDLGKHCWSRQIAELEGGKLSARECRLLNFRNTNLSAGYVGWGDEWGHCTLAPN